MTLEEQIKELILSKFGNVNAFAKAAGVPYSTVDTILKKSVLNASVNIVIKICRPLGISVDKLGDGLIVSNEQMDLTPAEVALLKTYRKLDRRGQVAVEETAKREYQFVQPYGEDSQNATLHG